MRSLPPRRPTPRARLAAVSLAAAGALSLLLPAVAAASTGHGGGGGGLLATVPMGSIFSDILGSVAGFGKDVVKTIFSSVLTLFFGGSWQVLLHPYQIVEWLIGLPGTGNTTAFVPFGNNGAGPFAALVKDTQAIGLGLLPLALANNTLHLISGGIFTRSRDHMHDFGKVFMAACAIVAWPFLFGQMIAIANTVTLAMLDAANANGNLWKTLGAYFVTAWAGGFLDLLTTGFLIATALLLVGLIVMKIVLMVALAFLLVVGPIAIAVYPFEFLSRVLMLFGSVFLALALIPLGWAVLFALFTAFGASVFGFGNFLHAGLIGGAMKDTFDLICSLICFYLAWKWPFLILGRLSSLIGGNVAAAGEAFSAFGHGGGAARAAAGGGTAGAAGAGVPGAPDANGLSGKLEGLGNAIQGFGAAGGGVFSGLGGSTAAAYAGYGLGAKGLTGLRAASSALRRNGGAPATAAATTGTPGDGGGGASPAGPVGTAVAAGPDAGFDALRASGKNFTSATDTPRQPGGANLLPPPGAPGARAGHDQASPTSPTQTLARDAAVTAALTGSASSATSPGRVLAGVTANGAATGGSGVASATADAAQAGLNGTTAPGANGVPQPVAPASPASGAVTAGGDSDPRQVLQASTAAPAPVPVRSGAPAAAAPGLPGPSSAQSAAKHSAAPAVAAAPAAAPRPAAAEGSRPAQRSSAATPPPVASTPARPTANGSSRMGQRTGTPAPPPAATSAAADAGRTPAADGGRQVPERPPAPVSPPENR